LALCKVKYLLPCSQYFCFNCSNDYIEKITILWVDCAVLQYQAVFEKAVHSDNQVSYGRSSEKAFFSDYVTLMNRLQKFKLETWKNHPKQ